MIKRIIEFVKKIIKFFTRDIWRINTDKGAKHKRRGLYRIFKAFLLAIRNINMEESNIRASALTFITLLALVPMLAVIFAIARGFNFHYIVKSQLSGHFTGRENILDKILTFIDNSLAYTGSNVFLGVGVVLLLFSIVKLLSKVEDAFNNIWMIKKSRNIYRKLADYLALLIIAPLFLVFNAGLSVFLNSAVDRYIIGIVVSPILEIIPYIITVSLFTLVYMYVPNTKVKFSAALFAGIFAGIAFQLFQMLYISGQIWITRYNAIYGSFAALPLLLLWLQLTWFICLFGVRLSFSYQNVNKYSFEHEVDNISRRYKDFVYLLVMALIIRRFDSGQKALSANEISENCKLPTWLTSDVLYKLQQVGLIVETPQDSLTPAFMPAMNPDQLTVDVFFDKLDRFGSEDFTIDNKKEFKKEWEVVNDLRNIPRQKYNVVLLKDL